MRTSKFKTLRFWFIQGVSVGLLVLFISLGTWQLGKGDVKSDIHTALSENKQTVNELSLPVTDLESWRYRQVQLTGNYHPQQQFLLDNQVRDGSIGYNVLTPFWLSRYNAWVLVDRGWIAQGNDRRQLPDVSFVASQDEPINGRIYVPYAKAYSLGGIAEGEDEDWPRRIQFVDYPQLAERLGVTLLPFTLRLDASQPHGYRRDWAETMMSAEKHYGYAFQWYAMAFALIVLWWLYAIKPMLKK